VKAHFSLTRCKRMRWVFTASTRSRGISAWSCWRTGEMGLQPSAGLSTAEARSTLG